MGPCGWNLKSQGEPGELRWETRRFCKGDGFLIPHRQMPLEPVKQRSYRIRFVFKKVAQMTMRTAD